MSYFDYENNKMESVKSGPVIDDLLKVVNSSTMNKLYKISDITADNGDSITQVNDLKDNMIMSMTTTSGNKAFYIIFFGKSFDAK
jgi:predicted carbohydrate-binding protein with CBM5 and CBM33 domain